MKLTQREKIMLIAFGIIAFLAASYFLVLDPQLNRIEELRAEEENCNQKVAQTKLEIASGEALSQSLEKMDRQIEEQSKRFYPEILEPQLIVLIDNLLGKAEVQANTISLMPETIGAVDLPELKGPLANPLEVLAGTYKALTNGTNEVGKAQPVSGTLPPNAGTVPVNPQTTAEGASQTAVPVAVIEKMTVSIGYDKSSYDQIKALVKGLESQNRTLVIDSLIMEAGEDGSLKGSISVTFYALPKLHEQDAEYLNWPYTDVYGKTDPFR